MCQDVTIMTFIIGLHCISIKKLKPFNLLQLNQFFVALFWLKIYYSKQVERQYLSLSPFSTNLWLMMAYSLSLDENGYVLEMHLLLIL